MKQKSFFESKSEFGKHRISHGGDVSGRKKVFRPLDRKRALHVTLKSSHAKGKLSLITNKLKIDRLIEEKAKKYQITIHRREIMRDHVHMVLSFKSRALIQKFLRVLSGLIARAVTGAQKGKPFGKRFWDHLVFTRIITSYRDFVNTIKYLWKNEIEREHGRVVRDWVEEDEAFDRQRRRRSAESILERHRGR